MRKRPLPPLDAQALAPLLLQSRWLVRKRPGHGEANKEAFRRLANTRTTPVGAGTCFAACRPPRDARIRPSLSHASFQALPCHFNDGTIKNLSFSTSSKQTGRRSKDKEKALPIWGNPQADPPEVSSAAAHQRPRSLKEYRRAFSLAWAEYVSSFEGFLLPERKPKKDEERQDEESKIDWSEKGKEVADNLERNVTDMQAEGKKLVELAKQETGISTKDELKAWAADQMKLATACLSEFMAGYRQGRDEEVDRMLNEYFQDLQENTASSKGASDENIHRPNDEASTEKESMVRKEEFNKKT